MGLFDGFSLKANALPGIYAPWLQPATPEITPFSAPDAQNLDTTAPSWSPPPKPGLFSGWDAPDAQTGLSKWDKVSLAAANLRDDPNVAANLRNSLMEQAKMALQTQALRRQQANQQAFNQRFGRGPAAASSPGSQSAPSQVFQNGRPVATPLPPTIPQDSTSTKATPDLNDPGTVRDLLAFASAGVNVSPFMDVLKAAKAPEPQWAVGPDGTPYNQHGATAPGPFRNPTAIANTIIDLNNPANEGRTIPQLDKGQEFLYDSNNRPVAIRNIPGYVGAQAESAGAVAGAQAQGTSPYEYISPPTANGAPRMVSKANATAQGGDFVGQTPSDAARTQNATNAELQLPQTIQSAQSTLDLIDKIKSNPSLNQRTGAWSFLPAVPGTPGAAFDAMKAQLQGRVFLDAYAGLKGGGQITEVEGKKATEAQARLSTAQSPADYKTALDDLASVIQAGLDRAKATAAKAQTASGAGGAMPSRSALEAEMRRRNLLK